MHSGITRLAEVLRARERTADSGLFCAKVSAAGALDDGCGISVPKGDYMALECAGDLNTGDEVLAAWVDETAVVLGHMRALN